jgi:hypothetical protein
MSALVAQNGNFAIRDVADLGFDFGWDPLAQIPAEDVQPLVQSGSGAEPFGRRLRAIALRMAAARFKSVGSIPCNRLSAVTPRSWAMRVPDFNKHGADILVLSLDGARTSFDQKLEMAVMFLLIEWLPPKFTPQHPEIIGYSRLDFFL